MYIYIVVSKNKITTNLVTRVGFSQMPTECRHSGCIDSMI